MAAVDYFLKIDGIDGGSVNPTYKEAIDIESFSWGLTNTGRAIGGARGGGGAGKTSFQDLHFTSVVSKASPKLMMSCAGGVHYKEATLTCTKAGKSETNFLTIKLTDVVISSYETGGSSSDLAPTDTFTLNVGKVEIDYRPQKDDGSFDTAIPGAWDLRANLKALG
jgi:type VI secretion system secreted protein Hcp